jgi:hypothetical protein
VDVVLGKRKLGSARYKLAPGKTTTLKIRLRSRPKKAVSVRAYAGTGNAPVRTLKVPAPLRR